MEDGRIMRCWLVSHTLFVPRLGGGTEPEMESGTQVDDNRQLIIWGRSPYTQTIELCSNSLSDPQTQTGEVCIVVFWPARAQIIRDRRRAPGGKRVRLSLLAATPPYLTTTLFHTFLASLFVFILVNYRVHANCVDLNKSAWLWLAKLIN